MKQINLYEAKTQLSSLVEQASKGESFVIAKGGKPLAQLVPLRRKPDIDGLIGSMAGKMWVAPDFDETPEELIDAFYGFGPLIDADNELRAQLEAEAEEEKKRGEEGGVNWLLDTNAVLALVLEASPRAFAVRSRVAGAERVVVSAVSIWEVAIKSGTGKLDVDVNELAETLDQRGIERLDVTWRHARAVRDLPDFHRDPFDRLLVAQAIVEPLRLLTTDRTLARYSDNVHVL